ncbi:MAG TPA: molybdopterin-binding protein [Candidatus Nitrosotenuis sp.]|nr:molybdopterin-binding protein [Candidatus Nitrosotenuis sp.]
MSVKTAAVVIIGNEILTGKVADANTPYITRRLWELGVEVRQVVVVPDEVEEIARAVKEASGRCDVVFTSGGVGPTHDDVTMEGVARAFDCEVHKHSYLENLLSKHFQGEELTRARGRLAEIPDAARLIIRDSSSFPQVVCHNVYILPGVPELFRQRFELLAETFRGEPYQLRQIQVEADETDVAPILNRAVRRFQEVRMGSYPYPVGQDDEGRLRWKVKLTLESRDAGQLQQCLDFLLENLPAEMNPVLLEAQAASA